MLNSEAITPGKRPGLLPTTEERDGLQENIILLNALAEKLEQYFALQTLAEFPRSDRR